MMQNFIFIREVFRNTDSVWLRETSLFGLCRYSEGKTLCFLSVVIGLFYFFFKLNLLVNYSVSFLGTNRAQVIPSGHLEVRECKYLDRKLCAFWLLRPYFRKGVKGSREVKAYCHLCAVNQNFKLFGISYQNS